MRRFISLFLIIVVLPQSFARGSVAAKTIQPSQEISSVLTTADILTLIKSGLSAEVIAAKLKLSRCDCDTSLAELERLKAAGVPDEVLVAMIASRVTPGTVKIPAGAIVELETAYRISSQEIRAGEAISFRVVNPVKIGDDIVIAAGSIATGRVVKATRGGHFGRAGRLAWTMETVTAVDGSRVPIQAAGRIVGDSKGAKVATQMVITGVLLGPFAPTVLLFGFKRGKNAYLAQGRRYDVTVTSDTTVQVKR